MQAALSVKFDASTGRLPAPPDGMRVVGISYESCKPTHTGLSLVRADPDQDHEWWKLSTDTIPPRYMRIKANMIADSMGFLMKKYAHVDVKKCLNHLKATAHFAPQSTSRYLASEPALLQMSPACAKMDGVPQFFQDSGNCWFTSMCAICFAQPRVRDIVIPRLPEEMREDARNSLYNREAAQRLRAALWHKFGLGDDVSRPPREDGQNGCGQMVLLCAILNIPVVGENCVRGNWRRIATTRVKSNKGKYYELITTPSKDEDHFLVLRHEDSDVSTKGLPRRIVYKPKGCNAGMQRYRFVGCFIGARRCGHQVALISTTGSWRDAAYFDADLHFHGIGPWHLHFSGEWSDGPWWDVFEHAAPVIKYGPECNQLCAMGPGNEADSRYDNMRFGRTENAVGTVCVDAVYVRSPAST